MGEPWRRAVSIASVKSTVLPWVWPVKGQKLRRDEWCASALRSRVRKVATDALHIKATYRYNIDHEMV